MKYLSDYTEEGTTTLLKKYGAFFAFSDDQFNEQKQEGIKYVSGGMGLICPKENIELLYQGMAANVKEAIARDIAENGKEAIIERDLYNHECFYTGDIEPAIRGLVGYGYTEEDVEEVYFKVRNIINQD